VSPTIDGIRKDHVEQVSSSLRSGSPRAASVIDFRLRHRLRHTHDGGCWRDRGRLRRGPRSDRVRQAALSLAQHRRSPWQDGCAPGELGDLRRGGVHSRRSSTSKIPRPLLKALRAAAPVLYCSVPNEEVMPFEPEPGITTAFHYQALHQARVRSAAARMRVAPSMEWHGQEGPESRRRTERAGPHADRGV
jgi:hypothetical protein